MRETLTFRHMYGTALTGLILNGLAWAIVLFFPRHDSATILHYTSTVGIDFVGEGRHIIVLPAAGTFMLTLNVLVGRSIVSTDKRVAWLLWSTAPLVQGILIMSLIFLISLNR